MNKIERKIIDIPVNKVDGIEKLFCQLMKLDFDNIPMKYKKAFDITQGIAYENFTMRALYESYEIDHIDGDVIKLKNDVLIESKFLSEVFSNSFALIFLIVTLYGFDKADEAENNMLYKLFLDSWGTAFIECSDTWVLKTIAKELEDQGVYATHSFSPGQLDIPLELQQPIFDLLKPADINVKLTDKYMMDPKKTISGMVGLKTYKEENSIRACDLCQRRDTCPNAYA